MTERPPEPPDGQDDPPDVRTAVHATVRILAVVLDRRALDSHPDLLLQVSALHHALARLRERLERGDP